jgi:hypothetical protein
MSIVGLSIAIALVSGSIAWQAVSLDSAGTVVEGADPAAGAAFYEELNGALAGDSDDKLRAVVTDDFVDHRGDEKSDRPAGMLIDQLTALGRTFPGMQLDVASIQPSGDDLIVDVVPVTSEPGEVAGLMLAPAQWTGGIEVLRVRRGKVSDRWASTLPSLSTTTFQNAAHSFFTQADLAARLYRIELLPGSAMDWIADELSLAMVESGSLAMTVEKPDELETPVTETTTVGEGTAVSIPTKAKFRLRSTSIDGATLLLFAAHDASAVIPWPFRLEGGARSELLWNSPAPFALMESARVQVGRIELPENMEIALTPASEMEIVAGIQDGPMKVMSQGGAILQRNEKYAIVPVDAPLELASGGAVQISQASGVDLGTPAETSASIWLVTIGPVDPDRYEAKLPAGHPGGRR